MSMPENKIEKRKLDVTFVISEKEVKVFTDSTSFVNVIKKEKVERDELISLYKEICKEGKKNKVRVKGKTKIEAYLKDDYVQRREAIEKRMNDELFEEIVYQAKYLKKRGIFAGYGSHDEEVTAFIRMGNIYNQKMVNLEYPAKKVKLERDLESIKNYKNTFSTLRAITIY